MKWLRVVKGKGILQASHAGDYLFHGNISNAAWEEVLCNLYSIAYSDKVAVNVLNICSGRQEARTLDYYESGEWYYLPFPEVLKEQYSMQNASKKLQ